MTLGTLWRTFVPLVLLLVCIGALIFGYLRLRATEKAMGFDGVTNMVWVISQTQVEALKMRAVLAEDPDDEGQIGLQYDLLRSRIDMLTEGPQFRFLQALEMAETVKAAVQPAIRLDPALRPLSAAEKAELGQEATTLARTLNRTANAAMVMEWELLTTQLTRYRTAMAQVNYSIGLGVVLAIYLGWRILADRRARLEADLFRRQSMRLEEDLDHERAMVSHWRDFAAVVSHQFRTPLAVIDSAAQRLYRRGQPASDEVLQAKQGTIREMVASLDQLVDAALLIGRMDHKMDLPQQAVQDLAPVVRNMVKKLQGRYRDREITLSLEEERFVAWCDANLVQHSLINLIDNAIKYSPPFEPVEVRMQRQDNKVVCTVADRGPGMTDAEAERLFQRFQRGAGAPTGGTGIGLWLAQRLAELQGGRIEARPRPEGGALFSLILPEAPQDVESKT
ncbi:His Kinase A (phospho-acceptor) domain-containing protein [Pseudooceanicola antarcticus]|uniref:histidine kinase n=1 Tax=Pseudooceanicola antarcticus TaxID=1247613 RepID=A0A285JG65_9RHOB|nr:HAMP domain-containing sensor histidine kinase [Pseudooceanicola antarcticus]PJE30986.1 sensor histidine kinase [Pseudooceanicola antarcticus]SNY59063.1 His Kinase A (phospho-acceptor) domain-containing protein [Pseudooceanicola antarcticus]